MLSLKKLEKLLATRNFVPSKFFSIDGICVYIEFISTVSPNSFYLYIPSKYEFSVGNKFPVYELKFLDIEDEDKHVAHEYTEQPNTNELGKAYTEVNTNTITEEMEDHLLNNYKSNINIDMKKVDTQNIKDMVRQIKRLKFSIENTRYKIMLFYKNHMCSIRRDNDMEFFNAKNYPSVNEMRFFVTGDLELIYEKLDTLNNDISVIKHGIHGVLERTQIKHGVSLDRLMNNKKDINSYISMIMTRQAKYNDQIIRLEKMLKIINDKIAVINKHLALTKGRKTTSLDLDMQRTNEAGKLYEDLQKLNTIRQNILDTMSEVNTRKENISLTLDKIMFDNQIMLHQIMENFEKLHYLK